MEKAWKFGAGWVVIVGLVIAVMAFIDGEIAGGIFTLAIVVVGAVFLKAGWNGKGLRRRN